LYEGLRRRTIQAPDSSEYSPIEFSEGVKMLREAGETMGDYDDLTTTQEKKLGQLILEK
jgi:aspartyl-tRNA synthetase